MDLISGIWLLDVMNLLKYNGVDIFDSILRVDSSTWWVMFLIMTVYVLVVALLKAFADK